jgi:hypothetical protein
VELIDADIAEGLEIAKLQRRWVAADDVRCLRKFLRGLELALGVDDPGAALSLCLGLAGHRPLHLLGNLDVLDLDDRNLDAPGRGLLVDDPL